MLTENSIGLGFVGIQVIVMIWLCVAFNSRSIFNYMYIVAKGYSVHTREKSRVDTLL